MTLPTQNLRTVLLLIPGIVLGCAIGPPTPEPSPAPGRPAPWSVEDALKFLREGQSEKALLARIAAEGLDARPTEDQIIELKRAGATEEFIAALRAAPVPPGMVDPASPVWSPLLPDFWPSYGWSWYRGKWHLVPWLYRTDRRPD